MVLQRKDLCFDPFQFPVLYVFVEDNVTNQSNLVDYFSSENIKPAIHDKKVRIDQLHACAISWNLCCDVSVESKYNKKINGHGACYDYC